MVRYKLPALPTTTENKFGRNMMFTILIEKHMIPVRSYLYELPA